MSRLVWFRNDLRCADNPALMKAIESKEDVKAIFFAVSDQWKKHDHGTRKISFIYDAVKDLSIQLASRGIPLTVINCGSFSKIPQELETYTKDNKISDLYINREYELNEQNRDRAVYKLLKKAGVTLHFFHDQCVVPPDNEGLLTSSGSPYQVFTPYKKKWLSVCSEQGLMTLSEVVSSSERTSIEPPKFPEFSQFWDQPYVPYFDGEVTRHAALGRLHAFVHQKASDYGETRDLPWQKGTSILSPFLSCGIVSPRECIRALEQATGSGYGDLDGKCGEAVWLSELVWRDFYRYVVFHNQEICKHKPFKPEGGNVPWRDEPKEFDAWKEGKTGVPIVDAGMRQLNATGWMHNRLRMITAMFLTKHLLIDWRWGEKYFMNQLVDGDFCSNNGGWQWSASIGTDAAPYFRIFNPYTQGERYDKEGEYIRQWCPELKSSTKIHKEGAIKTEDYPEPIVDHKKGRERALEVFQKAL